MNKVLPYFSALGIILFIYFLLPPGREFLADLGGRLTDGKENITSQYDDVKNSVTDFTDSITDTQKKFQETVDAVNETKASIEALDEKMEYFLKITQSVKEVTEDWQISSSALDPTIDLGRMNYNFADPGEDGLSKAHLELDIKPWIEWGGSENDLTTKEERIKALSKSEQGRRMLEKLGYEY
ncbi:MAG: hypothetical protein H7A32_06340 [Deltaproteobacteria bacterium]|nr:hypothetical protein [Deltaproteobacteria bacterium]